MNKMKTGRSFLTEPTKEQKAFILSFMAVIWRRNFLTALYYCEHHKTKLNAEIIMKCLKYNVLSQTGIGNQLKFYLLKAFKYNILMPNDYKGNPYVESAVHIFGEAWKAVLSGNKEEETKLIHNYSRTVFMDTEPYVSKNKKEVFDMVRDFVSLQDFDIRESDGDECCNLCKTIDSWDIKLELLYSQDPYNNVIMTGLMRALERYTNL